MNKKITIILIGALIILVIIFSNVFGYEHYSNSFELIVVPVILLIYLFSSKEKPINFTLFLVFYSIGDFIWLSGIEEVYVIFYYVINGFFILGYIFLLLYIFKNFNFKKIVTSHKLEFFILVVLFLYVMYVLFKIVRPTTEVTESKMAIQLLELIYNTTLLLLLTSSVLYYIQNNTKKNLVFFVGCAALVFSELILIGYYYMVDDVRLSYVSTVLYISGFLFLYYHSLMKKEVISFSSN